MLHFSDSIAAGAGRAKAMQHQNWPWHAYNTMRLAYTGVGAHHYEHRTLAQLFAPRLSRATLKPTQSRAKLRPREDPRDHRCSVHRSHGALWSHARRSPKACRSPVALAPGLAPGPRCVNVYRLLSLCYSTLPFNTAHIYSHLNLKILLFLPVCFYSDGARTIVTPHVTPPGVTPPKVALP